MNHSTPENIKKTKTKICEINFMIFLEHFPIKNHNVILYYYNYSISTMENIQKFREIDSFHFTSFFGLDFLHFLTECC